MSLCEFILPRFEDVAFGLDRLRRDLIKFFGEFGRAATLNFGFETGDARGVRGAALANFTELCGKFGVVDLHQDLAFLHDRAFVHQNFPHDAAFKALQHLNLPRRHDAAIAAFDLVEFGEMRPGHARRHQGDGRHDRSALEVRGVRSSEAARMSLMKARSDCCIRFRQCLWLVGRPTCRRLQSGDDLIARPVADKLALLENKQPID